MFVKLSMKDAPNFVKVRNGEEVADRFKSTKEGKDVLVPLIVKGGKGDFSKIISKDLVLNVC